ncbi:hypothetical protein RUM43_012679 [Polyplax serrata]|uniref:EF-hand domain-containing protein n=1 Tax=Polyplax serrata TaxID=468196 RepID=A0AAN8P2C5_POLSC
MLTGVKFNCRRGSLSLRRFGHVLLSLQKRFEAFASGVWILNKTNKLFSLIVYRCVTVAHCVKSDCEKDNNGSIENEELRGFLKDLLELVKKDYDAADLEEFEETILQGVDYNQDGKINRKELTMILLALAKHSSEEESK